LDLLAPWDRSGSLALSDLLGSLAPWDPLDLLAPWDRSGLLGLSDLLVPLAPSDPWAMSVPSDLCVPSARLGRTVRLERWAPWGP
jgi:hypothetical protein